jgi:hypothetical protein
MHFVEVGNCSLSPSRFVLRKNSLLCDLNVKPIHQFRCSLAPDWQHHGSCPRQVHGSWVFRRPFFRTLHPLWAMRPAAACHVISFVFCSLYGILVFYFLVLGGIAAAGKVWFSLQSIAITLCENRIRSKHKPSTAPGTPACVFLLLGSTGRTSRLHVALRHPFLMKSSGLLVGPVRSVLLYWVCLQCTQSVSNVHHCITWYDCSFMSARFIDRIPLFSLRRLSCFFHPRPSVPSILFVNFEFRSCSFWSNACKVFKLFME